MGPSGTSVGAVDSTMGHRGTDIGPVDDQYGALKDPYYDVIIMLKHSDKMEYVI